MFIIEFLDLKSQIHVGQDKWASVILILQEDLVLPTTLQLLMLFRSMQLVSFARNVRNWYFRLVCGIQGLFIIF